MIGHIFLKDLRRLWPFVLGLAALQIALAVMQVKLGFFPEDQYRLGQAADFLGGIAALLAFFVAVLVVQLDPLPDDRQDWLARPIRRWDLLLAKLLFVAALVHGPMLAAHLLQGLAMGFPARQALVAAVSWNVYRFVTLTLPALMLAVLTRTIGQMLGLGLAVLVGAAALIGGGAWLAYIMSGADTPFLLGLPGGGASLAGWVLRMVFVVVGGTAILSLQYFRRETLRGRVVLAVAVFLVLTSQLLLPQSAALAMQGWVSSAPGQGVSLSFVGAGMSPPAAGTGKPLDTRGLRESWSIGISPDGEPAESADGPGAFEQAFTRVVLPLHVEGLPPNLALVSETVRATFTAPGGKSVWTEGTQDVLLRLPGQANAASPLMLRVPKDFFRDYANQPVRVELDFLLGILKPHGSYRLPVPGADRWLPEGARCITRINESGNGAQLHCLQGGEVHMRLSAALVDGVGRVQNLPQIRHLPSEAPWSNSADMITRVGLNLPLGRMAGGGSPTIAVTMSQPLTHVMRHVAIPALRLSDWQVDTAPSP